MKKEDVEVLSTVEIQAKLNDAREELMKFRFQLASGELSDVSRIRHTRRMVARYLTALNSRAEKVPKGE